MKEGTLRRNVIIFTFILAYKNSAPSQSQVRASLVVTYKMQHTLSVNFLKGLTYQVDNLKNGRALCIPNFKKTTFHIILMDFGIFSIPFLSPIWVV